MAPPRASFTTKRISQTTFVIQEHDAYGEHPLIYVKISPRANVIVLSDTGCNAPSDEHLNDRYTNLRRYLGHYPVTDNNGKPLNSQSSRKYIIICSHCHFDHTLGIPSFVEDGQTADIVASAAGRDFIESDLDTHGLFKYIGKPAPKYTVTKWAQAFERLTYPFHATPDHDGEVDLGITVLHTPGHTPDELAWYDHDEMHLYVGDSFYREGEDGMPIVFPKEGSMIEWVFSMQKLAVFVRAENARAADDATSGPDASDAEDEQEEGWVSVSAAKKPRRVLVSCAHQTYAVDGAEILAELEAFSFRVFIGRVPLIKRQIGLDGQLYCTWREPGEKRTPMSIKAPLRLLEEARKFFNNKLEQKAEGWGWV